METYDGLTAQHLIKIISVIHCTGGRGSSVGIMTRYGLEGQEIESRWGGARFSAPVLTDPGARPMGTGSFPGVQRPGRDADHPPHLAPRLKKE